MPAERDLEDDPEEAETGDAKNDDYEYIVEATELTSTRSQRTPSHYPVLPALGPDDIASDETEAALRRIRERLTDESRAQRLGS